MYAQVRVKELTLRRCKGAPQRSHSVGPARMSQDNPQL
jgi:hypothetical protein